MNYFKRHRIFKLSAQALILASTLCILFGNGVHLHSIIDHVFDHGDVHINLHAHSNSDQNLVDSFETSNVSDKEHVVSTIDLNGVLSSSKLKRAQVQFNSNCAVLYQGTDFTYILDNLVLLNLPPPDIPLYKYLSPSFSLRAPPIA